MIPRIYVIIVCICLTASIYPFIRRSEFCWCFAFVMVYCTSIIDVNKDRHWDL